MNADGSTTVRRHLFTRNAVQNRLYSTNLPRSGANALCRAARLRRDEPRYAQVPCQAVGVVFDQGVCSAFDSLAGTLEVSDALSQ